MNSQGRPRTFPMPNRLSSGGLPQPPPRPPKLTARELLDSSEPGGRIFVPDFIESKELAELLGLKPFKVVAEVLELDIWSNLLLHGT